MHTMTTRGGQAVREALLGGAATLALVVAGPALARQPAGGEILAIDPDDEATGSPALSFESIAASYAAAATDEVDEGEAYAPASTQATATIAAEAQGTLAFAVAEADDRDAGPEVGNSIIVTASKRAQTLQDTPIAVSVTSGEVIERAQIRDVLDLQTVVPSLRVEQQQSSSSTTFFIRGFGNGSNNLGIEPSVGVFVDGVFRSRSAGALSDLNMVERIEVLSGPQSTLFGKNASAGVISVVTKEPQYEWGGVAEASYGNFDAFVIRGEVTGPLAENVAFSHDGSYNRRDGYAQIANLDTDISDRNRWSARGQLLIEPTADLKIRAIADRSRIDEVCCHVSNLVTGPTGSAIRGAGGNFADDFFNYQAFLNQEPINKVDNYGGSVQVDWSTGPISFTSITAYRELKNFQDQDVDFTSADMVSEIRDQRANTFTQEFRITSDFDGPFNFLLGGFYFDETIKQDSIINAGRDTREVFTRLARAQGQPNLTFNDVELALGLPQNPALAQTDWTGPYEAIHGGYAFQRGDKNETVLFDTNLDGQFNDTVRNTAGSNVFSPGFCSGRAFGPRPEDLCRGDQDRGEIGIRAGYDWQLKNNIVLGVVVGFTDSHLADSVTAFTTTPANYIFRRELQHFYSARLRGGYAFDNTLLYATGGGNYGEIRNRFASSNTANVFVGNDEDGSWGYELGAGLEHRISDKISIGAQYTYREFTSDDYVVRATPGTTGPTHPFRLVNQNGTDFTRSADNFESNALEVTIGYRF